MANVTHPGAGLSADVNIQTIANGSPATVVLGNTSNPGNTSGSNIWILDAANGDVNASNGNALGAVEMGSSVLVLEPGVTVREKAGSFAGTHQSAFRWIGRSTCGVTFGAGSSIFGRREDHAADIGITEYRPALKFLACNGVTITGNNEAHLKNWFGDGLWFASNIAHNQNITVTGVKTSDNHRHGCTIEDVINFTMRNCGGTGDNGTGSSRWCLIEPDNTTDRLTNVLIENCTMFGHASGMGVNLNSLDDSNPISVVLRNCDSNLVSGSDPWGYDFNFTASGASALGTIDCYGLRANGINASGFYFLWQLDSLLQLNMRGCVTNDCARVNSSYKPWNFDLKDSPTPTGYGIRLFDCEAHEPRFSRKVTQVASVGGAATNVRGNILVQSPRAMENQGQSLLPRLNVGRFGRLPNSNSKRSRLSASRGAR